MVVDLPYSCNSVRMKITRQRGEEVWVENHKSQTFELFYGLFIRQPHILG